MSTSYFQEQQAKLNTYLQEVKAGKPIEVGKQISTILEYTLKFFIVASFFALVCSCMAIHTGLYYGGTLGTIEVAWAVITLLLFLILLGLFIALLVLYRKYVKADLQKTSFKWNDKIGECLGSFIIVKEPPQESALPTISPMKAYQWK